MQSHTVRQLVSLARRLTGLSAFVSVGYSSAAQAQTPYVKTVQSMARAAVDEHVTPGIQIAVAKDDEIEYEASFGSAGPGRVVLNTTRFEIGSLTKAMTAAAALRLVELGKLHLDDTIDRFLPHLPNAKTITIRELLLHTSGLHNYPDWDEKRAWPKTGPIAPAQIFARLAQDAPDFAPGTQQRYSNAGYAALGGVIAQVSGERYEEYLRDTFFVPYNMSHTSYGFAAQAAAAVPAGYGDDGVPRFTTDPHAMTSLDLYYSAYGLTSNARDVVTFDAALRHALDDESRRIMYTPAKLADGTQLALGYGAGFGRTYLDRHEEQNVFGYAPGAGGWCANFIFPKDGLSVAVLTNSKREKAVTQLAQDLVKVIFEADIQP